ncbi:unnamed protein product [Rotaria sordida]|uniref:OTU domain-containing protein n=1 Tax=Rotaria sordida TaxID=392033 RepID=A0A819UZP3_9BILA|nr:unnamed protein product [Rotaria sordida]CAF0866726.1 unnamed protein product [Rotaria sordida]CAF0941476.1 unnamed protein product [Rotaria sordida]CAF0946152.1 unnamed protein product [Rotaria sordida]CAF0949787.1 unnamed protein product [Rotaria sordida]
MKSYNRFCLCSRRNEVHNSDDEFLFHEQQLTHNLINHNIQRLQVKGDGNCLFYALAEGLIYEMKMDPNRFHLQLEAFGLSSNFRLIEFANRLRQICVNEWKSNEQFYSQFVDTHKVSFHKEIKKFSKNGVSDSTLGDIVPLTISNIFNIKIIIFTSVSDLSQIEIKPANGNNLSLPQKTIFLAYNQYGLGHYDAAYPHT